MPSRALTIPNVKSRKLQSPEEMMMAMVAQVVAELPMPDPVEVFNGQDGRDGKDGYDGKDGRDGRDGQDGVGFRWRGNYNQTVQYQTNDVVNYGGSTYIATKPSKKDFPNRRQSWDLMASAGAAGTNGVDGSAGGGSPEDPGFYRWGDYVLNYAGTPTVVGTVTEGDVYEYQYDNGTAYRLVPTDGISEDAFYTTFTGGVLSGFIVNRSMAI